MTDSGSGRFAQQVASVSALAEPVRRSLYQYVVSQPDPVGRDEAAAGVGVPRHKAKFHLDRLVEDGLLEVEFKRLTGRTGPGAGRPAKLYRRASAEVSVSLPGRRYDLAGAMLADAIDRTLLNGTPLQDAVAAAAAEAGAHVVDRAPAPDRDASPLQRVADVLAEVGYEPTVDDDTVTLTNCPFDALATEHAQLVCQMNLSLIEAVTECLGSPQVRAELDPAPPNCCVRLHYANETRSA